MHENLYATLCPCWHWQCGSFSNGHCLTFKQVILIVSGLHQFCSAPWRSSAAGKWVDTKPVPLELS